MKKWFVAHTHANAEEKAQIHLQNQGFETYLPKYLKRRRHARRQDAVTRPLFPRYLFIRIDTTKDRWRAINSTFGVCYLIGRNGGPLPVPDELIGEIRARESEIGFVEINSLAPPKPGEGVKLRSGSMAEISGIFECLKDDKRVVVLLNLLGRVIQVETDLSRIVATV